MDDGGFGDRVLEVLKDDLVAFAGVASPRRMDLLGKSVVRDVGSWLLGEVPGVGTFLADAFADNLWADMRAKMSPAEDEAFVDITRRWPDTVALIQAFQRVPDAA